jgi:hypothetical protein
VLKLTPEEVREIRDSALPRRLLAEVYGVRPQQITAIRHGHSWRENDDPRCRRRQMDSLECAVAGCTDNRMGLGLCSRHYQRLRKNGHPLRLQRAEIEEARAADDEGVWRCCHGHRVLPENTYFRKGKRECRICQRIKSRRSYWKDPEKGRQRARKSAKANRAVVTAKARLRLSGQRQYLREQKNKNRRTLNTMFPAAPQRPWTPEEDALVLRDDITEKERCALLARNGTPRGFNQMRGRRDMLRAGRGRGRAPAYGERNPAAKLTENDVMEIRASDLTGVELARIYGVSQSMIGRVRHRLAWTHL